MAIKPNGKSAWPPATFDHIPETPVKELAHMFGFHDEFHFSKTFKRLMGTSPQQYKFRFKERR